MNRKPYDPSTQGPHVHDRRARDVNRGQASFLVEAEVDDPYEPGGRIATVRSVRDDPLGDHYARGHVDEAQYQAGRQFQHYFEVAERGPKAVSLAEAVDGSLAAETLTDAQMRAGKWLTRCYTELGRDGSVLVHEALIRCMTTRQIATSRGLVGAEWERYFAKRLFEALNTLALVFGFASASSP